MGIATSKHSLTECPTVTHVRHSATAATRIDGERAAARAFLEANVTQGDDAVFVIDIGTVQRMHAQWTELLPRVEPFYAVKCNEDPVVLQALEALGTGFDCASAAEIERVVALGVSPDRIIYANPTKQASHLTIAQAAGVTRMTFDNHDELVKIKALYPDAELVIRVLVDDSYSVCRLGTKYGAHPSETKNLLQHASTLGLRVVGVSFHVGSGCQSARAFSDAVEVARVVFDEGLATGFNLTLLDVGGGFPGSDNPAQAPVGFPEIAEVLGASLDKHFPPESNVRIIAEPGRYFVCASHTEACCITSRRVMAPHAGEDRADDQELVSYYINDGVYGSFNCTLYDHVQVFPQVLVSNTSRNGPLIESTVWGPTCDSMDKVATCALPKLEVGDWMLFDDMGAYTCCASSEFNGFTRPIKRYIFSAPADFDLTTLPSGFPMVEPASQPETA